MAVLGSLLASRFTAALPASVAALPGPARAAVQSSLGGALAVARGLPAAAGAPLAAAAKGAYVSAMSTSLVAAASVAVAAAVMVRRFYPDRFAMAHASEGAGPALEQPPAEPAGAAGLAPVPVGTAS